jgi:cell division protein FtsQ
MKQIGKYILLGACGVIILACIICSVILGKVNRGQIVCRKIEVVVSDSLDNRFISADHIRQTLVKEYGKIIGEPLDSIDLNKIESIVDSKSAVYKSQVYTKKDSSLNIEITQRKPIVRFQKGKLGFYADKDGYIFPLQSTFTAHVQIVDGNIPITFTSDHKGEISDPKEREWFLKTINLVNMIEEDDEWKRLIVQIHVNQEGDMILVPREGEEKFLIGKPEKAEEKLDKLKKYYTAIIPKVGKDRYKHIDLRFKGQIICK